MLNKILIVVAFFLLIVIVSLLIYKQIVKKDVTFCTLDKKFNYVVLDKKPILSGEIVKNPDMIYNKSGWLSDENPYSKGIVMERDYIDWKSNGYYTNLTIKERNHIIVIHPLNITTASFVEQDVFLPVGKKYNIVFGIANLENYLSLHSNPKVCHDNLFIIKTIDKDKNKCKIIFQEVLKNSDGWKDFSIDISNLSGKNITIRLEGVAGGLCGIWDGEWGSVDYMDIIPS